MARKSNKAMRVRPSRRGVNNKNFPPVPRASLLEYRGVIPANAAEEGIVVILRDTATFSTGGGTSFTSILDNNPSGTDNWTEYSTSWSEYRVLGVRYHYAPTFAVNTAAVNSAPLAHAVLHMKSSPAISSYSNAVAYGDSRLGHVNKMFTREWRMASAEEGTFLDTAAPAPTAVTFTAYAEGLSTGLTYGVCFRTWLVQFRNPRK